MSKFLRDFKVSLIMLCLASMTNCLTGHHHHQKKKQLLCLQLDGFRYDYVSMQPPDQLPGFTKFLHEGVKAEYMNPIFPSVTFPSWTSILTGLYAESHGIVGNSIYDPKDKDFFYLNDLNSTQNLKWWKDVVPIYTTSTLSGKRTAVILTGSCDIPIGGVTPEYCEPFRKVPDVLNFKPPIDRAILKLTEGYDFVMVYNTFIDDTGHKKGPETEEMKAAVRIIDSTILYLQNTLELLGISNNVNIVIISDHGMVNTLPGIVTEVELSDYLPFQFIEQIVEEGSSANIKVMPGYVDQVFELAKLIPGMDAYKKETIPDRLHYKNHEYIHDILLKPRKGTWIVPSNSSKSFPPKSDYNRYNGGHGYDPQEMIEMRAFFAAKGPDFQSNKEIPPIQSVDVYPLMAHLLGIVPNPNNGTLTSFYPALATRSYPPFFYHFLIYFAQFP